MGRPTRCALADDPAWPRELAHWAAALPGPRHPHGVGALGGRPGGLVLDDRGAAAARLLGFPQRYSEVLYAAPPAGDLVHRVAQLLGDAGVPVARDEARGLDHGAHVPLVEMFPEADVPVVQLSLPNLDPQTLFGVGERLARLRREGTLVIGSGFTTHNLRWFDPRRTADAPAPSVSQDVNAWAAQAMARGDVDAILDTARKAPTAAQAHPRTEHWAPPHVALEVASAGGSWAGRSVVDGFWYGL